MRYAPGLFLLAIVAMAVTLGLRAEAAPLRAVDIGVDTDIAGNTATSLGNLESCNSIAGVGGTLQVDVVVQGVPPYDPGTGSGGIIGFQFNLLYDPSVLRVVGYDERMMLTAAGESVFVTFSDSAPDSDGDFLTAAADLGDTDFESGDGILTRITLEAVGVGTSVLQLTESLSGEPMVFDADASLYPNGGVANGAVVVGDTCDPDGDVDTDGDTIPNSTDPDDDGDGVFDVLEQGMSTDELGNCSTNSSHDAWPSDFDHDGDADPGDNLGLFFFTMGESAGDPFYSKRSDFDGDGDNDPGDNLAFFFFFIGTECYEFTFTNNTGGVVDDITITFSGALVRANSALDSDLDGWGTGTLSAGNTVLDLDRPDAEGDLAAGGTLTVVVIGPSALTVSSCQWTLDGVDQGAC